jgi:hypothetical protein
VEISNVAARKEGGSSFSGGRNGQEAEGFGARPPRSSPCRTTARDRQGADPEDLRQAPLRLEVPPAADEPRPAGDRDQRRRALLAAHDGAAGGHHVAHVRAREAEPVPGGHRTREERAREPRRGGRPEGGGGAGDEGGPRDRGALPEAREERGRVPEETAVANPHARFVFKDPDGNVTTHERVSKELAARGEIKPHPYGSSSACSST